MPHTPTTQGQRLRLERERLTISEDSAAILAGISKTILVKMERGEINPSGTALAAFSSMGMDILYLVTGERSPSGTTPGEKSNVAFVEGVFRHTLSLLKPLERLTLLAKLLKGELDS